MIRTYPLRVAGHRYAVTLERSRGILSARVVVPTRFGPVTICAQVDERDVRRALRALARSELGRGAQDLAVGGVFDDIGTFFTKTIPKAAKKVARSKVFRDVAKGITAVTSHPAWTATMAAVNVIPGYGQAISAAMLGARVAAGGMSLLARGKAGDPKAQGAIRKIGAAARAGDPKAQQAMARLKALNAQRQTQRGQPNPGQAFGQLLGGLGGALGGAVGGPGGQALGGALSGLGGALGGAKPSAGSALGGALSGLGGGLANALGGAVGGPGGQALGGALSGLAGALGSAFAGDDGLPGFADPAQYAALRRAYQNGCIGGDVITLQQARDGAWIVPRGGRYGLGV